MLPPSKDLSEGDLVLGYLPIVILYWLPIGHVKQRLERHDLHYEA
jgi:hypothetical protein